MQSKKPRLFCAATLFLLPSSVSFAQSDSLAVNVYKTPWCGCCSEWAEAVGKAGYVVASSDLETLTDMRSGLGVPQNMEGCHVATIEGYFLEGHVPLAAIEKLLSDRPDIAGIAVPGMPVGSLGMGDERRAEYDVYAVPRDSDGAPYIFYRIGA